MEKKNKFLVCVYYKYLVEEIYPFDNEEQLKKYFIKLLQHPPINNVESYSIEVIMHHINKRWNYTDGDFWRLVYKLNSKQVYELIYQDI